MIKDAFFLEVRDQVPISASKRRFFNFFLPPIETRAKSARANVASVFSYLASFSYVWALKMAGREKPVFQPCCWGKSYENENILIWIKIPHHTSVYPVQSKSKTKISLSVKISQNQSIQNNHIATNTPAVKLLSSPCHLFWPCLSICPGPCFPLVTSWKEVEKQIKLFSKIWNWFYEFLYYFFKIAVVWSRTVRRLSDHSERELRKHLRSKTVRRLSDHSQMQAKDS